MFSAAVGRYIGNRALHDFEQGLLNTLAADITGNRGVLRFSANLINFIDVDDAGLRPFNVPIRCLNQAQQDIFDVLADIACLGQGGRIRNGKRYIHRFCQSLRQHRFTHSGRADQQHVALGDFHAVVGVPKEDSFVVVVDCHAQSALGSLLPDDILIQHLLDFLWLWHRDCIARCFPFGPGFRGAGLISVEHLLTQIDALVTDAHPRTGNHPLHLVLILSAERAS